MNNRSRKYTGKIGELLAQQYLKDSGYGIIKKNFRCRYGEIDIIAGKENILAFVEVKTRTTESFGKPAESVDNRKINRIIKISELYISRGKYSLEFDIRFDIISLFIERTVIESLVNTTKNPVSCITSLKDFKDSGRVKLEHIENAF